MRARVLFAGLVAISTVITASPASTKPSIAEAKITGPGIEGEITIERRDTADLWEYAINAGRLDDTRADSVLALRLTPSDLEVRYLVTYRFGFRDEIRQDLYPYAEGGPVTYTPPHQKLTGLFGGAGYMRVTPGWYQSRSSGFLRYLVNRGLPGKNAVAPVAAGNAGPGTAPEGHARPWTTAVVVLAGLAALSLAAAAVRRRVLAGRGRKLGSRRPLRRSSSTG